MCAVKEQGVWCWSSVCVVFGKGGGGKDWIVVDVGTLSSVERVEVVRTG